MLRKLIATQIIKRLKNLADKTATQIDNKVVGALEQPIAMIPVVPGLFFALQYLNLEGVLRGMGLRLVRSFIVFVIFWGQWLEIKEKLALKIKENVEGAGAGFAFTSRMLYMSSPAGEKSEVFMPPGDQPR